MFGRHGFGHYQQHTLQNAERLDQACAIRSTDKHTVSSVSIPAVFRGNCTWRDMPFTACNIDEESVAPEMSGTDVIVVNEFPASSRALYMNIAVHVHKRGNSSKIARLPKKRRLSTATEPAAVFVKRMDVLDVMEAMELSHMSPWL